MQCIEHNFTIEIHWADIFYLTAYIKTNFVKARDHQPQGGRISNLAVTFLMEVQLCIVRIQLKFDFFDCNIGHKNLFVGLYLSNHYAEAA